MSDEFSFIELSVKKRIHVRTYPEKMVELLSACRTASTETTDATVFYLSPLYTTDNLIHCCLLEDNFIKQPLPCGLWFLQTSSVPSHTPDIIFHSSQIVPV